MFVRGHVKGLQIGENPFSREAKLVKLNLCCDVAVAFAQQSAILHSSDVVDPSVSYFFKRKVISIAVSEGLFTPA